MLRLFSWTLVAAFLAQSARAQTACGGSAGPDVIVGGMFRGCGNSAATGGAVAFSAGALAPDTLVITSAGEGPAALSVFFQASASAAPVAYGDGLSCLAGAAMRIASKHAIDGRVAYPELAEAGIRARSTALGDVIPPGGTRYYQVAYRDPASSFCPATIGGTFNSSSGLIVVWP